jgi:hypothetical protein
MEGKTKLFSEQSNIRLLDEKEQFIKTGSKIDFSFNQKEISFEDLGCSINECQ